MPVVRTWRRFLDNDVRVGAAEPERVHAHDARAVGLREWFQRGVYAQLQSLEVDVRIGGFKMEIGGHLAVLEHEDRFHETGDARGGFQVAKVRLYRAEEQRGCGRAVCAQGV